MKKIVALVALVAFLGVSVAPSFAAIANRPVPTVVADKDPKSTKTETKKTDAKQQGTTKSGSCSKSCGDKSSSCDKKAPEPKK